jgi:hypothetical protein
MLRWGTPTSSAATPPKAAAEYQKVTELAPDNSLGYQNIGAVYLREGLWSEAIP